MIGQRTRDALAAKKASSVVLVIGQTLQGAPTGWHAGEAGKPAGLAMGTEALRAAATASQAAQRPEHLDLRGHRASKITAAA